MKHKHADLIHAWADGAKIQMLDMGYWHDVKNLITWEVDRLYRIKPMPKPDMYKYIDVRAVRDGICQWNTCLPKEANLGLIFDGETQQLKSAEVLK